MMEDLKAANKAADILIAEALKVKEQRDELLKACYSALVRLQRGLFREAEQIISEAVKRIEA